ncbi:unnamed protein product [Clonostachys rosea f. rosea IK726]|uniref:Uncharacterized protein n=1 Tax=Clonostachys rosea f. rosea IK726 TaxID=1349383 RepID=A0ACA9UJQ3_BIOOC|nr:unnamed protein product [Clonostachys rosea f. rosea IK726]
MPTTRRTHQAKAKATTNVKVAADAEPRRSVRTTKGQHTKSFDELETPPTKRRQTKKSKKVQEQQEPEATPEEPEEIIRCVCGATEQDEDSGEAWISCEQCLAWQHNVCVGVSSFEDEIPDHYWCEQCRPDDHKELLEGIARGEKPWEARRKAHEEKEAQESKKKKKGGRRGKGKRAADPKDKGKEKEKEKEKEKAQDERQRLETEKQKEKAQQEEQEKERQRQEEEEKEQERQREIAEEKEKARVKAEQMEREKAEEEKKAKEQEEEQAKEREEQEAAKAKAKPSPDAVTEAPAETTGKGKRKNREGSQEADGKPPKVRRVSAEPAGIKPQKYTAPENIPETIKELPGTRTGPGKALKKSILHVLSDMAKHKRLQVPEGETVDNMAEKLALQIERAVYDTHPGMAKGQKEYSQQIKSLTFNLKNNPELVRGLLEGVHTPPALAVMTSDQLASAELQRQTAEMKARVEKQSILLTQDSGPRVRRTHKGEEVVEDDNLPNANDEPMPLPPGGGPPTQPIKDESVDANDQIHPPPGSPQRDDNQPQHSPTQSNFDIGKVFSSVRSPSVSHPRRPSAPVSQPTGPGEDPDVDRMLQDENDSPPYSPTEEAQDPDVVWRGMLAMSTIANFQATAKHIGGANFSSIGPWSKLIPQRMSVAGRIQQQNAVEYLCGLRYSSYTDVIVVNLEPATPEARPEFTAMIEYFASKKRYGVVGDKVAGNVRDTYLVPVLAGEDNYPEFMLNLADNHIPKTRTEPMLLAVFVYRSDPAALKLTTPPTPSNASATPTPTPQGSGPQRSQSVSGPAFSPATPQATHGGFNAAAHPQTPVPIPQPPYTLPRPSGSPPAVPGQLAPQHATPVQGQVPVPQPPPAQHQQYTQAHPAQHPHPQQAHQQQPKPPQQQPSQMSEAQRHQAQQLGQAMAHEVLGPQYISAPTAQFLIPQAWQMSRKEWEVIKNIYERDPRAREDLQYLGGLLDKEPRSAGAR